MFVDHLPRWEQPLASSLPSTNHKNQPIIVAKQALEGIILTGLLIIAVVTIFLALFAKRLSSTIITPPMFFLALGVLFSFSDMLPKESAKDGLHLVAEVALVILLFLDAAKVNLAELIRERTIPLRMLLVGLPLAIIIGAGSAGLILPNWPLFTLALLGAILAPTDAALGQSVISDPEVPEMERQSLSVESGLNDGLALPAVLLFASLASVSPENEGTNWLAFIVMQLTLGPLVGGVAGYVGGWIFLKADERKFTASTYEGISTLALAGAAYLAATLLGGNGFIAAFVAGLAFGSVVKGKCQFVYDFTESEGQLLSWTAFFLLGFTLVPEAALSLTLPVLLVILTSLFVVRPAAIWLSLIGTGLSIRTRLFFGWFGPRGLATALFALLIVDKHPSAEGRAILMVAINAVWISALLHGVSAAFGARWYGGSNER
ncbi:cation:proton antiporter [Kordiimonas sp.]|uniref:cation:proton antiporter n=1 Tax=Kordiimonas sp. TaxID=1970157 RepID=UPI003A93EF77